MTQGIEAMAAAVVRQLESTNLLLNSQKLERLCIIPDSDNNPELASRQRHLIEIAKRQASEKLKQKNQPPHS